MDNESYIQELTDHLELIKSDLRWQLSFEDMDWDHFSEFVKSAKVIRDKIEELKLANIETSGPPENVLVDTKASYEVDKQTQPAFGPTPDEAIGCFISKDPDPDLLTRDQLFILVLQTAIAALTFADEHGYFVSPSAAAEVWSFINGYEGGLDFEKILKGLQVEEDEIPF